MNHACAVCGAPLVVTGAVPYRIGPIGGLMCTECNRSFGANLTRWMRQRLRDVEAERAQQEKLERQRQEKAAAALLAKETTHAAMAQLALEGLPIATRSEMARARRSSAA